MRPDSKGRLGKKRRTLQSGLTHSEISDTDEGSTIEEATASGLESKAVPISLDDIVKDANKAQQEMERQLREQIGQI